MVPVFVTLLNHRSHWDLTQTIQNTKRKKKNYHQQKPQKENAPMLNVKTSTTKGSYTDIPFPLDSLARNISRGVYTGPSVTLVPVIIILVSRYVNSTLFIRYHGFSWQTSLWAFSQSLLYINDINQNGIYQKIPKSIRHVILRAFLQAILRSAIEVLRNRNGSPTRKHQASWFPMEKKKSENSDGVLFLI